MMQVTAIINDFVHLFYPHICAGCGTDLLNPASQLCLRCIDQLPLTNFHIHANNPVEKKFWGRIPVANAAAYCHFTGESLIQHLLHQLKYNGHKEIGYFLGRMMGNALLSTNRFKDVDILIPLPLFAAREKRRGYNQATILSEGIAQAMKRPVIKDAIVRLSATETQTHKNRVERWQNMEGRFRLTNPALISEKHILLIDDVITTGATLEACGQALLQANNLRLSIVTLAYTV